MSRFACTILALLAIANTGAYAASNYDELATTGLSATVNVGGAGTGATDCGAAQLAGAHGTITVAWDGFTSNDEATVSIKLCYTDDKIVDRPWRKFNKAVDKNKQCWQIPELTKFMKKEVAVGDGSTTIEIPTNTPASTYYVQVLGVDSNGEYVSYANSDDSSCKITVHELRPHACQPRWCPGFLHGLLDHCAHRHVRLRPQEAGSPAQALHAVKLIVMRIAHKCFPRAVTAISCTRTDDWNSRCRP